MSGFVFLPSDRAAEDRRLRKERSKAAEKVGRRRDRSEMEHLIDMLRVSLEGRSSGKKARGTPRALLLHEFGVIDQDHSGAVDEKEFMSVVGRYLQGVPRVDLQRLFRYFDADDSGTISSDEFTARLLREEGPHNYAPTHHRERPPRLSADQRQETESKRRAGRPIYATSNFGSAIRERVRHAPPPSSRSTPSVVSRGSGVDDLDVQLKGLRVETQLMKAKEQLRARIRREAGREEETRARGLTAATQTTTRVGVRGGLGQDTLDARARKTLLYVFDEFVSAAGAARGGGASLEHFEAMRSKLPTGKNAADKAARMKMFRAFDPNGNGYLSLAEVTKGVRDVLKCDRLFDAKPAIMRAFQAAKDAVNTRSRLGADFVERVEFRALLVYLERYFQLHIMFSRLDTGSDQRVNYGEFVDALGLLRGWGIRVGDPRRAFAAIDVDGGGEVLFAEFADWVLKKHLASSAETGPEDVAGAGRDRRKRDRQRGDGAARKGPLVISSRTRFKAALDVFYGSSPPLDKAVADELWRQCERGDCELFATQLFSCS